jgi:general secretion pathway protein G
VRSPWDGRFVSSNSTGPTSAHDRRRKSAGIVPCNELPSNLRRVSKGRRERGFTIVEIMITVAIILTIAAIGVPNFMLAIDDARNGKAVGDIRTMEDGIELYLVVNNVLPDDLSQVGYGGFLDPWGNPYEYLNHSTMHGNGHARKDRFLVPLNSDYDLYSMGPDGKSSSPLTAQASKDDIIRAADGNYIGLASQF